MTIEEKDLKIVYFKPGYYILYVLKNKKELKEDSEDLFRVYGYFTNLDSAFNSAIHFRKNKKYPFKETWKDVLTTYSIYKRKKRSFKQSLDFSESVIYKLEQKLFNYGTKTTNYWKV